MRNCRACLEEELDMVRVQAAMDRATVKELRLCLTEEHQGEHVFILRKCFVCIQSYAKLTPFPFFFLFFCIFVTLIFRSLNNTVIL